MDLPRCFAVPVVWSDGAQETLRVIGTNPGLSEDAVAMESFRLATENPTGEKSAVKATKVGPAKLVTHTHLPSGRLSAALRDDGLGILVVAITQTNA
jgi:hypothetical protein